jgi:galactose-1-phosphate uridylyltransferase
LQPREIEEGRFVPALWLREYEHRRAGKKRRWPTAVSALLFSALLSIVQHTFPQNATADSADLPICGGARFSAPLAAVARPHKSRLGGKL